MRRALILTAMILGLTACQTGGLSGNDQGSEPINEQEGLEYQQAIVRCYKMGGTRVVKILNKLRCY